MSVKNYKKFHKPLTEDKTKFHQGYFIPKNKEKCLSKENIYRSSWELKFFDWLDRSPKVLRWAAEPIAVQYLNPILNLKYCIQNNLNPKDPHNWKKANYYLDAWMEILDNNNKSQKYFIEIKPYSQTKKPEHILESSSLKEHKAYNRAAETYLVNLEKWKAAIKFCNERGVKFIIITEKTLGDKLGLL